MGSNINDLEQLMHDRISTFAASERPKEIIDTHIEKLFQTVIETSFASYGAMGDAVKQAIKNAMPGNIDEMFELTRYNNLIANALKEKWEEGSIANDMVRRATESMDEVLSDMETPETISLRELLEAFIEDNSEEATRNQWDQPDIRFTDTDGDHTYFQIFFDKTPREEQRTYLSGYSLSNHLSVSTFRAKENADGHLIGKVYAARVDGDVMGRRKGVWHTTWEKLMVALYYGGAKLVIDCDESDFSYPGWD